MTFEEFLREKMKKSALFGSYRFDVGEWCELAEEWHSQEVTRDYIHKDNYKLELAHAEMENFTKMRRDLTKDYIKRSELPSVEEIQAIIRDSRTFNHIDYTNVGDAEHDLNLLATAVHERINK